MVTRSRTKKFLTKVSVFSNALQGGYGVKFLFAAYLLSILNSIDLPAQHLMNLNRKSENALPTIRKYQAIRALKNVGQWAWGPCRAVQVKDHFAFIGNGEMFQVLDITDPSSPKIVGEVKTAGLVLNLSLSGNYAFVLDPFQIIDISTPSSPRILFSGKIGSGSRSLTISGNYAYVGDLPGFIFIIDITDPYNPNVISQTRTSGDGVVAMNVVDDSVLYATTLDGMGLDIIDVSDKKNPKYLDEFIIAGEGGGLALYGNCILVGSSNTPQLTVLDITTRTQPIYLAGLRLQSIPHSIVVDDSVAYISEDNSLSIIRISNKNDPQLIARLQWLYPDTSWSITGPKSAVTKSGYIFTATVTGLWTVEAHDPRSLKTVSFFPTGYSAGKITVSGNLGFVVSAFGGMKVVDISDYSFPKVISHFSTPFPAVDIKMKQNIAFLLCEKNHFDDKVLYVIDISTPDNPKEIETIDLPDTTKMDLEALKGSMAINDSLLAIARKNKTIVLMNYANNDTKIISSIQTFSNPHRIVFVGSYLFSAGEAGLEVFSISQPLNPSRVAFLNSFSAIGLCLWKDKMLVATGTGLLVLNITNPDSPVEEGFVLTSGSRSEVDMAISDNYVYMAYNVSLRVIDLSTKNNPTVIDSIDFMESHGVAASTNLVLVANGEHGLRIFSNSLISLVRNNSFPYYFALYQNYPNPFNPLTNIVYRVAETGKVSLKVFDALGREVATLASGIRSKGVYNVQFNASTLASGIYFYRLQIGSIVETKKLVITK